MPTLEQGRIVWAALPSSDGTATKRRPAVIVTPTDQIEPGQPVLVVAATTKFPEPLPPDHVLLPWQREGKVRTQLREPTAAVCTWLLEILETEIHKYAGVVPPKQMIEIMKIVNQRDE